MSSPSPADLAAAAERSFDRRLGLRDPAFTAAMRLLATASAPFYDEPRGRWLVTRWRSAHSVLGDPQGVNELGRATPATRSAALGRRLGSHDPSLLFLGPPDHSHGRRALAPLFSSAALRAHGITDRAEAAVAEARRLWSGGAPVRLGADLVHPLCLHMVCRVFGLPRPSPDEAAAMVADLYAVNSLFDLELAPDALAEAHAAGERIRALLLRTLPANPAARRMRAAGLAEGTIVSTLEFMLRSGVVTTGSLLMAAVARWLGAPGRPADGTLIAELSPTLEAGRVADRPLAVDGVSIPSGQTVMVLLQAVHSDPDRPRDRHLAFGAGPYHCLGAGLVRALFRGLHDTMHRAAAPVDHTFVPCALTPHHTPGFRGTREMVIALE